MSWKILRSLIRFYLEHPLELTWTVQGFGMLRTKMDKVGRIHIWDSSLRVPRVSDVHEHAWPLSSTVISGELINQRFHRVTGSTEFTSLHYLQSVIATGEGGGLRGSPKPVRLMPVAPEFYTTGLDYHQKANEIHRTIPQDGCITLLERPQGPPLEETMTYWPKGSHWVSAEPRIATHEEIRRVLDYALNLWSED